MISAIVLTVVMFLSYYLMGSVFVKKERGTPAVLLAGFLSQLALFELLTLPAIAFGFSMRFYWIMMFLVIIAFCVVSAMRSKRGVVYPASDFCNRAISSVKRTITFKMGTEDFLMLFAILMVAALTAALVFGTHLDDDDAFYVATATTSVDTDSIFRYNPYTGDLYKELPSRYVLSPWPLYGAFWAYTLGMRPVVVFHTVFPTVLIPMAFLAMYLLGRVIWRDDPDSRIKSYGFIIALSFLHIFSAFSTWSVGMRLLIRVWQGKIVLASVILPAIFVLMLEDWDSTRVTKRMFMLTLITLTAGCFVSSMGVVLAPLTLGCLAVSRFIMKRDIFYELMLVPCCIVDVLLGCIYLVIK